MTVEERSSETVRQQRVQWSSDGEGGPDPGDVGGMGDCMSVYECTGGGSKREVSWTASSIFLLFFFLVVLGSSLLRGLFSSCGELGLL